MIKFGIQDQQPDLQLFQNSPNAREDGPGVLVIEDDQTVRTVLARELRRRGFVVWEAADGAEGVEQFRLHHDRIGVVLSDVRMPVLDGPHALDAMRLIDPAVRCCFMTAAPSVESDAALAARGAAKVFTKPFSSVSVVAEELQKVAAWTPTQDGDR